MFTSNIIVEDNLIPMELQNSLEERLLNQEFPWYLCANLDVTGDYSSLAFFNKLTKNIYEHSQMHHNFFSDGKPQSFAVHEPIAILQLVCKKYNITAELIRIKANLCAKVQCDNPDAFQTPHIDNPDEHWTMLYYVNESDGDTFLFNEHYVPESAWENITTLTLHQRISPKKGRIVIFNGRRIHAGMFPRKNNFRIAINFNFRIKMPTTNPMRIGA